MRIEHCWRRMKQYLKKKNFEKATFQSEIIDWNLLTQHSCFIENGEQTSLTSVRIISGSNFQMSF